MVNSSQQKLLSWVQIATLCLLVVGYLFKTSPVIYEDSLTYIAFDPMRPPVYPLFIWLFHGFGKYQFVFVMWIQTIITFLTLLYAKKWLHEYLKLSKNITFSIVLLTMLVLYYYRMPCLIGSEGLAFPLFIITFLLLVGCFESFDIRKILFLAISANILILTRLQFYYLYVLMFLLVSWYLWRKISFNKILMSIIVIALSIATTDIINRGYHYFMHGTFKEAPIAGLQLIVQALYLSDKNASMYFSDPEEKKLFTQIMSQLEALHFTKKSELSILALSQQGTYAYYGGVYNPITAIVKKSLDGLSSYQKDNETIHMSTILYSHAIKENVMFYLLKVGSFFGGIPIFLSYLLILCGVIYSMIINKTKSPSYSVFFTAISLLTILINTVFVMIPEAGIANYFFYSYFLFFCLSGLLTNFYING